jgi:hypothetical protein
MSQTPKPQDDEPLFGSLDGDTVVSREQEPWPSNEPSDTLEIGDPSVFGEEGVTRIEPIEIGTLGDDEPFSFTKEYLQEHDHEPVQEMQENSHPEPLADDRVVFESPLYVSELPSEPIITMTEEAMITVSEAETERFHQEITAEAWERLKIQTVTLEPAPHAKVTDAGSEMLRAVIESRNTRTRDVFLTLAEFEQAQRQILDSGYVNIPGKALVLEATAITQQVLMPEDTSRRRRRRA